jgi:hypothetical protein
VQFSGYERREDILVLERRRWFAEVRACLDLPSEDIAQQFGPDPATPNLYFRPASRWPKSSSDWRICEGCRFCALGA